jgi:hypothetical protein
VCAPIFIPKTVTHTHKTLLITNFFLSHINCFYFFSKRIYKKGDLFLVAKGKLCNHSETLRYMF